MSNHDQFPAGSDAFASRPEVLSLGQHEIMHSVLPSGELTSVQPLDRIDLAAVDYQPGVNKPQEIAFTIGRQHHTIFSSMALPRNFESVIKKAGEAGIEVGDRKSPNSDPEDFPWLHAQYNESGQLIGAETIAADVATVYTFENGKPIHANSPPVLNLQARWYEGAHRRYSVKDSTDAGQMATSLADPKEEDSGKVVRGIAGGLSGLGTHLNALHDLFQARADELRVNVAKLPVDEMNTIIRKRNGTSK